MPDLVPGVVSLTQQGERPGGIGNIGKGMADVGVDEPLCPLAFGEPLENEESGNTGLVGPGALEVGGPGDGCNNVTLTDLAHQLSGYPGAQIAFTAGGIVWGLFGHWAGGLSIHVDVVEEEKFGSGLLTRGDDIVDDPGPLLSPDRVVIGQADAAIDDGGA